MEIDSIGGATEPIAIPPTAPASEEPEPSEAAESRPPEIPEESGKTLDLYV